MAQLPDVVIVTLTHFPDIFQQLNGSVEEHEPAWRHRIAVSDGEMLEHEGWSIIRGAKSFNYARNWNIGLKAAPPDCDVLLVNDDVQFFQPNGIAKLRRLAHLFEDLGVLSPVIDGEVGNPLQGLSQHQGLWYSEAHLGFVCVYIKRSTIDKVGLMDEQFDKYGGDDVDYCRRVQKAGLKLGVTSEVTVRHGFGERRAGGTAQRLKTREALNAEAHEMLRRVVEKHSPQPYRDPDDLPTYQDPGIEGWMTLPELRWLHETAKQMESIVEVGSWKGRSTHALLMGCSGTVTAVDHWRGSRGYRLMGKDAENDGAYQQFLSNVSGLDNLEVVRKPSLEAAQWFDDASVDMVFIDASHLEDDVRTDIRAWAPKAKKLICGHDYSKGFPGVCAAVDAEFGEVQHLGSIWWKSVGESLVPIPAKALSNPEIAHRGQQDQFVVDEVITQDCYRLERLAKLIPAPKIIVDVGGHIGTFGIKARSLWPDAYVVAYEPNRESAALYRRNVPDALVHGAALSYEPEKTMLAEHVGAATGGGILTDAAGIVSLPGRREVSESDVELKTMERIVSENLLERIDLLKLDCEGGEIEALRQMLDETAARIKFIVGEYHMNVAVGAPRNTGYAGFEVILKARFPHFDVIPLNKPGQIGTFAAGPPEVVKQLALTDGPLPPFKTPLGNLVFLTFIDGPRINVKGAAQATYNVRFINEETGECVYGTEVGTEHWAEPSPKYFVRWRVLMEEDGRRVVDEPIWLDGKKVLIVLSSKSLGDTVAWAPYAEEFRKVHSCEVHVATFWRSILEKAYPDVAFHDPGVPLDGYYAVYVVGCFDDDYNKNPNHWQTIPLQQVATDCLGLPWQEIRPRVQP